MLRNTSINHVLLYMVWYQPHSSSTSLVSEVSASVAWLLAFAFRPKLPEESFYYDCNWTLQRMLRLW
jgi:hypothetical protein